MKIYISGPISGRPEPEYTNHFGKAELRLLNRGHTPVNPVRLGREYSFLDYETILRADLELLKGCDAIYMLSGWQSSHGARVEYLVATDRELKIMREESEG